jgi:hypothetical protein
MEGVVEIWDQPIDLRIAVAQERLYKEVTTSDLVSKSVSRYFVRGRFGRGGERNVVSEAVDPATRDSA